MISDKSLLNISFIINILLMLLCLVVSNTRKTVEIPVQDKILIDKINRIEKENTLLLESIKELKDSVATLKLRKQKIKIEYREKIKFIDSANSKQLDSLIRANW
jgi:hypothetical protein